MNMTNPHSIPRRMAPLLVGPVLSGHAGVRRLLALPAMLAALVTVVAVPTACAQRPAPPSPPATETVLRLGDSAFHVLAHTTGRMAARRTGHSEAAPGRQRRPAVLPSPAERPRLVFLNVHDDENTSVEAALVALRRVPARLVELRHTGERNLTIRRGAQTFAVDPNRMFTDAGAARSLASLSRSTPGRVDSMMLRDIRRFADTLLAVAGVAEAQTVVTLHNNTEANYSARSYLPGAEYASDAEAVHLAPGEDTDDFFFVTDRPLYDALARAGFNVVLQNNATVTDDGSLSVLAARRGQRYVNVEAQHGHTAQQRRMVEALVRVLATLAVR